MPKRVNRDRSEAEPATDGGYESGGLGSFIHTSSIKIEYHRTFQYCLTWERPMYPRHSSRPPKPPKRSPSPDEEAIKRRLIWKRRRSGLRQTEAGGGGVKGDEGKDRDIIDAIDTAHDAKRAAEEPQFVEVTDNGVDGSDEDGVSSSCSVASGPSILRKKTKKQKPRQDLCSACRKLHQKAKRMKAPIRDKLSDNDPKSLTCDQWVLIKTWRPRRLLKARGTLLAHVQLVRKRLRVKNAREGASSACSRPHAFLQRNLRRCVQRVPEKKERKRNRRKRKRDDTQGPRVAKQLRLHAGARPQHISTDAPGRTDGSGLRVPVFEARSPSVETFDSDSDFEIIELIPSEIILESAAPAERAAPEKKPRGFRDLLAQLRGNSSIIVRETR